MMVNCSDMIYNRNRLLFGPKQTISGIYEPPALVYNDAFVTMIDDSDVVVCFVLCVPCMLPRYTVQMWLCNNFSTPLKYAWRLNKPQQSSSDTLCILCVYTTNMFNVITLLSLVFPCMPATNSYSLSLSLPVFISTVICLLTSNYLPMQSNV